MKRIKEKYRGKIIYCTPGSGKTTLVENHILFVDADVLMKEAIEERHPEFPFQDGMTIQNYIRDFTNLYKYKTKINNAVLKKAHKLCEDGLTVLTGTIKLSKNADFVFVLKPDSPRLLDRFKTFEDSNNHFANEINFLTTNKVIYRILDRNLENELFSN
jgi:broad-specificity NMP kinase